MKLNCNIIKLLPSTLLKDQHWSTLALARVVRNLYLVCLNKLLRCYGLEGLFSLSWQSRGCSCLLGLNPYCHRVTSEQRRGGTGNTETGSWSHGQSHPSWSDNTPSPSQSSLRPKLRAQTEMDTTTLGVYNLMSPYSLRCLSNNVPHTVNFEVKYAQRKKQAHVHQSKGK